MERGTRQFDTSYNVTVKSEEAEKVQDVNIFMTSNSCATAIKILEEEEASYFEGLDDMVNSDIDNPKTSSEVMSTKRSMMYKFSMISDIDYCLYRITWILR